MSRIKNVIFNDPATIVFWNDGTKTVVKCGKDDTFDPEKGLAMAISKYFFDNAGYFNDVFKKWIPKKGESDGMDIVEFVEKVCNFSLSDYQKEFVRKVYDAAKNEKRLCYTLPRTNNRFSFELLQAIVLITIAQERGLLIKGFL